MTPIRSVPRPALGLAALFLTFAPAQAQSASVGRDALGDPLPEGAIARFGTRRLHHETDAVDVAFTADGSQLWSIDIRGGLRLWDAQSGALIRSFEAGTPPVSGFSLPADASRIAISREGVGATVVDPATGAVQLDLSRQGSRVRFSPDGHWLAVWGPPYSKVSLLSAADGSVKQELNEKVNDFFDVDFSRDGTLVALSGVRKPSVRESIGVLSVRDTATGAVVHSVELKDTLLDSIAFSPDGRLLAAGDEHGRIRVIDARSGESVASADGFDVPVRGLGWSPDGRVLGDAELGTKPKVAGGLSDGFSLRDGHTLALVHEMVGHSAGVAALAFSPDSHRVASACRDHVVRLWDAASGERLLAPTGHETAVNSLAATADGGLLFSSGNDGNVATWNTHDHSLQHLQHETLLPLVAVACTPDGRLVVASCFDGTVAVRSGATGEDRGGWVADPAHSLRALAFLPDGHTLASAEQDGKVRLRDLGAALAAGPLDAAAAAAMSHPVRELDAGGATAFSVAVSPDGKHIATGTSRLRLFDATTGAMEHDIKGTSPIGAIAFSPDGTLVATGYADRTVRLYDAASGKERGTLSGHDGRVHALAFSRDGLTLASAGESESIVRLWDVARLAPAGQLVGHADVVNALQTLGPGLLASSGDDDVILVWRLPAHANAAPSGG